MSIINCIYDSIVNFYNEPENTVSYLKADYTDPFQLPDGVNSVEIQIKSKYESVRDVHGHKFLYGVPAHDDAEICENEYAKYVLFVSIWIDTSITPYAYEPFCDFVGVDVYGEITTWDLLKSMKEKELIIFDASKIHSVSTNCGVFGVSVWFYKSCEGFVCDVARGKVK